MEHTAEEIIAIEIAHVNAIAEDIDREIDPITLAEATMMDQWRQDERMRATSTVAKG